MNTIEYDIYCDADWVAGTSDLDEAVSYAQQYREDGMVEVYEVKKQSILVLKMSKLGEQK